MRRRSFIILLMQNICWTETFSSAASCSVIGWFWSHVCETMWAELKWFRCFYSTPAWWIITDCPGLVSPSVGAALQRPLQAGRRLMRFLSCGGGGEIRKASFYGSAIMFILCCPSSSDQMFFSSDLLQLQELMRETWTEMIMFMKREKIQHAENGL